VFFVNSAFEDEKRIVRINNIQVKESVSSTQYRNLLSTAR